MAFSSENHNQDPNSCLCNLCMDLQAMVYCQLHNSGLCLPCDYRLHTVNITPARHVRSFICDQCRSPKAVMRCIYDMKSLCALCWGVEKWKQQAAVRIGSYSGCPTAAEFLEMLSPKSNTCNVEEGITIMDTLADNHCYNNSVKPKSSISLLASVGYENASQRRLIQLPNTSLGINSSNLIGPQLAGASLDINNSSSPIGSQYDYSSHLNAYIGNAGGGTSSVQLGALPHPSSMPTVDVNQYGMRPNFQNNQNSNCVGYCPENVHLMPLSPSLFSGKSSRNTSNQDGVLSPTLQYQPPKRKRM